MRRQGKAEAHRKCRGFIDGRGEMASSCVDGLVAEVFWKERGMAEDEEGLLIGIRMQQKGQEIGGLKEAAGLMRTVV
jgi:hypothetical protein